MRTIAATLKLPPAQYAKGIGVADSLAGNTPRPTNLRPNNNITTAAFCYFYVLFSMQIATRGLYHYLAAGFMLLMLCAPTSLSQSTQWRKLCRTQTPVPVKELSFGKGSILKPGTMLMWGEWVVSFKRDSLPKITPYAPIESYTGKAFAITGLQAYSTHQGAAQAEFIYDGRSGHKSWDIDIWQPRPGGTGAPLYHLSFYINGPDEILVGK